MPFIHFSKDLLHNLNFSLEREILLANNTGSYYSTTISNCNTRKYHGLLVVPQPQVDDNKYVFLSGLDETILQGTKQIQLGIHNYPNTYYPKGNFYLEDFSFERCPQWIIKADDIIIKKEIILVQDEERILIQYTVEESKTPFTMKFNPFLAFRNFHSLSKSNVDANKKSEPITNGIKLKMYSTLSDLYLQFSKKSEFTEDPEWNYNNEYKQERERGYDYNEDLYCPGYFTLSLKKGDNITFSAGLTEINPQLLKTLFDSQLKKNIPLTNFKNCLENAAQQFIVNHNKRLEVTAGLHWFGQWGRDTFIALPGLTLSTGHTETCKRILDSMLKNLKHGLFPNIGNNTTAAYNTADASLWFIWALQQYAIHTETISEIWKEYGSNLKSILENYKTGTLHHIHMLENGLLYAGESGVAVTWMDAIVDGKAVTPRIGTTVELNALWYNAIRFSLEAANYDRDENFISEWESLPTKIETSYEKTFWNEEKKYLADYADTNYTDWSLRPNQVMAASLPYSPIRNDIKKIVLKTVKEKLLTPRGLRTLATDNPHYKGVCFGSQRERDLAYHQGTVWPWLLGHFAEAYLKTFGESAMPFIQSIYENFAPAVLEYGIGTIAEIYDGDEPHKARGTISQAWSVAELLRIRSMMTANHNGELHKIKKTDTLQIIL